MQLDDKITIAVAGPIKSGKDVFVEKAQHYKEIILQSLLGNFWVPPQLTAVKEQQDQALFEKYSAEPKRYALEFQIRCLASRLEQQDLVDRASGVVLLGQPLEVDRWIYAEANREHISDAFATYEKLYEQVKRRVTSPDIWVYLQVQDVEVLKRRIAREGLPGERKFLDDDSYLRRIMELNDEFFRRVQQPVINIDAAHPVFDGEQSLNDGEQSLNYFPALFERTAKEIRQYKEPPRLTLDEWESVDYNTAQDAAERARRQLRDYLQRHQTIITLAGSVGLGKTGMAKKLSNSLEIEIILELQGKNDAIRDELLSKFLQNKARYGYDLQKHLLPKRAERRKELYNTGKSFVEDRSPVEDQSIFWRRFHQQGYLSDKQLKELQELAKTTYAAVAKSEVMIKLNRPARECRQMILKRGRHEEIRAWPLAEIEQLQKLYEDFFTDMEQYGSHEGPKLEFDLAELNPKDDLHKAYMFQEMLHSLIEYRSKYGDNPVA